MHGFFLGSVDSRGLITGGLDVGARVGFVGCFAWFWSLRFSWVVLAHSSDAATFAPRFPASHLAPVPLYMARPVGYTGLLVHVGFRLAEFVRLTSAASPMDDG